MSKTLVSVPFIAQGAFPAVSQSITGCGSSGFHFTASTLSGVRVYSSILFSSITSIDSRHLQPHWLIRCDLFEIHEVDCKEAQHPSFGFRYTRLLPCQCT